MQKNLCCFCAKSHIEHNIINFSDLIFTDEKIKELTDKMNELQNLINKLDEIKSIIIKELDELKENTLILQFNRSIFFKKRLGVLITE